MTRHELKEQLQHDQFTDSVSGALQYASSHKQRLIQWGIAAAVVLLLLGAALWFNSHRRAEREADLAAAFLVLEAQVGPPNEYAKTFATQEEKQKASIKALIDVVAKDRDTREGFIAQYYLGTLKAQKNDTAGAESDLKAVANSNSDSAALAKIALAQLYNDSKRTAEAQTLLRSIIDKPTDLVSKAQAQLLLAQTVSATDPQQAKRILADLRRSNPAPSVSRAADQITAQISK